MALPPDMIPIGQPSASQFPSDMIPIGQPSASQFPSDMIPVQSQGSKSDPWEGYSPALVQGAAGVGSALDTATLGASPWAIALGEKGLGKLGVSGFENEADMPVSDIKKRVDTSQQAANEQYPMTSTAGQAAGIVGGAFMLPGFTAAKGAGTLAKMAAAAKTGASYGATSGYLENLDPGEAMKGAFLGGAAGGILSPFAEKVLGGMSTLWKNGKPVTNAAGELSQEAIDAAKRAGMSDTDIKALQSNLATSMRRLGATPQGATHAQFSEFGIDPTIGMATGDAQQLAREAEYAGPSYGRIQQQAANAASDFVGGQQPGLRDAVATAVNSAENKATDLKKLVDQAYADAQNVQGHFDPMSLQNVGSKIMDSWAQNPDIPSDFRMNPLAQTAAENLDAILGQPYKPTPNATPTLDTTFRWIEGARKNLNLNFATAQTDTDRAAIRQMIESFDGHIEDAINNGAFSGDPNVVNKWKQARSLFSQYQDRFGVQKTGEDAGSLLKSIISNNTSEDDVARMMFNFAQSGDASMRVTAMKTYNQLERALGQNTPELQTIRNSFIQQMMTPNGSNPAEFSRVATQINNFLDGSAAGVSKQLLSQPEREALARYQAVMSKAGNQTPEQLAEEVGKLRQTVNLFAPSIASGMASAFGYIHPIAASIAGAVGSSMAMRQAVRNLPASQAKMANAPLTGGMPIGGFFDKAIPLAAKPIEQYVVTPQNQNQPSQQASGGAVGRATGGRVGDHHERLVSRLMTLAERAKKDVNNTTEPLLNVPDATIVKALHVANQAI